MDLRKIETDIQTMFVVFALTLAAALYFPQFVSRKKLPPGPWGFPLFGHLPLLGKFPHLKFTEMARKYGPVFRIRMGNRATVVVSGQDAIREALLDKDVDFAGRPDFESMAYVAKGTSFGLTSYSLCWRLHRKIGAGGLRMFGTRRKPPIDQNISEEAQILADELLRGNSKPVDPSLHVKDAIASVILAICFGDRLTYRENPLLHAYNHKSNEFTKFLGAGNYLGDFIPWMKPFTKRKLKKFIDYNDLFYRLLQPPTEEHLKTFENENLRDAMDTFIQAAKETPEAEKGAAGLVDEAILLTATTLTGAGMTTSASILNWALLYMASFPDVQKCVHVEIDEIIGNRQCVTSADRGKLPYTEACILEIMRYSSIFPLSLPHSTVNDTRLVGYDIPKDTLVYINLWSVNFDETLWKSPQSFRPERFLSADRKSVDKQLAEKFFPFGMGRRRCPGEHLARLELFLIFVTLMQRCRFRVSSDYPVSLEPEFALVMEPQAYRLIVEARE